MLFRSENHALRDDSGGAGKFRGGLGVELTYKCLVPCQVNINFERTKMPPWGLAGGGAVPGNALGGSGPFADGAYEAGLVLSALLALAAIPFATPARRGA